MADPKGKDASVVTEESLRALVKRSTPYGGVSPMRILVIHSRWNKPIVDALVGGIVDVLRTYGIVPDMLSVAGSWEIVYPANRWATAGRYDAIIAVGCLIKGETTHFEEISRAVSHGCMGVNLKGGAPLVFGVLSCLNSFQAEERAGMHGGGNHGDVWAHTAVEMALTKLGDLTPSPASSSVAEKA